MQFQEATVITLLELSDMNEELDQFHHNTKNKNQPDYIVADLKAITVLKKLQTLLNYHYIMKIFLNLKKGWSIS